MKDIHAENAAKLFNCVAAEVTPEMRELAKRRAYIAHYAAPAVVDRIAPKSANYTGGNPTTLLF